MAMIFDEKGENYAHIESTGTGYDIKVNNEVFQTIEEKPLLLALEEKTPVYTIVKNAEVKFYKWTTLIKTINNSEITDETNVLYNNGILYIVTGKNILAYDKDKEYTYAVKLGSDTAKIVESMIVDNTFLVRESDEAGKYRMIMIPLAEIIK